MRKNIKTTEAIFPMPVLLIATYNEDGSVNVMNAAWGMMLARDKVALNLSLNHKTVKNKLITLVLFQAIRKKINF